MTPRILTTIATAGAAFALAVPAAWGSEPYRDHGDAAAAKLLQQSPPMNIIRDSGDAVEAKLAPQAASLIVIRDHGDTARAKLRLHSPKSLRDHGDATQAKLARNVDAVSSPLSDTSVGEFQTASGSDVYWSQLGIGFAVGMFFVLVLVLVARLTRSQRLAH